MITLNIYMVKVMKYQVSQKKIPFVRNAPLFYHYGTYLMGHPVCFKQMVSISEGEIHTKKPPWIKECTAKNCISSPPPLVSRSTLFSSLLWMYGTDSPAHQPNAILNLDLNVEYNIHRYDGPSMKRYYWKPWQIINEFTDWLLNMTLYIQNVLITEMNINSYWNYLWL